LLPVPAGLFPVIVDGGDDEFRTRMFDVAVNYAVLEIHREHNLINWLGLVRRYRTN
jgi:hypothetical protein